MRTVLEARVLENGVCQIGMEAENLTEIVGALMSVAVSVYQAVGEAAGEVDQAVFLLTMTEIFHNAGSDMWESGVKRMEMERDGDLMVNVGMAEELLQEIKERKEAEEDAAGEPDAGEG